MPADTGRVAVYQYRTGKMPMCKTVDHCYEGGSKTVVDRYHSGNNLGTGPVLFQYYNVYWEGMLTDYFSFTKYSVNRITKKKSQEYSNLRGLGWARIPPPCPGLFKHGRGIHCHSVPF